MATWEFIKSVTYRGYQYSSGGEYVSDDSLIVIVEQDLETVTPVSVKIRFRIECTKGSNHCKANGYYLLLSPDTMEEQLYTMKAPGSKWSSNNCIEIELGYGSTTGHYDYGKGPDEEKFTVPSFWICNTGSAVPLKTYPYNIIYADSGKLPMKSIFAESGYRSTFATRTKYYEFEGPVAETPGAPSITITPYTGYNEATISGFFGKDAAYNQLDYAEIVYTTDGSKPSFYWNNQNNTSIKVTFASGKVVSGAAYSTRIEIPDGCKEIKAKIKCVFSYDTVEVEASCSGIVYCKSPSAPTSLFIGESTDPPTPVEKLTTRKPWELFWGAATANHKNSPIEGYTVSLWVKKAGTSRFGYIRLKTKIPGGNAIYHNGDGGYYTPDASLNRNLHFVNIPGSNSLEASIQNPESMPINVGDTIRVVVWAYSFYAGDSTVYDRGPGIYKDYLIQSAGVVHLKTGTGWSECPVLVYDGTDWQEAESIKIKTDTGWTEAE